MASLRPRHFGFHRLPRFAFAGGQRFTGDLFFECAAAFDGRPVFEEAFRDFRVVRRHFAGQRRGRAFDVQRVHVVRARRSRQRVEVVVAAFIRADAVFRGQLVVVGRVFAQARDVGCHVHRFGRFGAGRDVRRHTRRGVRLVSWFGPVAEDAFGHFRLVRRDPAGERRGSALDFSRWFRDSCVGRVGKRLEFPFPAGCGPVAVFRHDAEVVGRRFGEASQLRVLGHLDGSRAGSEGAGRFFRKASFRGPVFELACGVRAFWEDVGFQGRLGASDFFRRLGFGFRRSAAGESTHCPQQPQRHGQGARRAEQEHPGPRPRGTAAVGPAPPAPLAIKHCSLPIWL